MPDLEITGWESKGLRIPDTKIEVASKNHHTYIQMPNGMGKTTTLWLIKFALDQTHQDTHPMLTYIDGKEDLSKTLIRRLKKSDTISKGNFKLRTKLDGKNLDIHLDFDFTLGKYIRTYTFAGQPKRQINETGKPVRNLIKSGVSNYILLDGERAKHFLDGTKSSAKEAIHSLYKIELIDDVHTDCTYHIDDLRTSLGGKAGVSAKVTLANNQFKKAVAELQRRKARSSEIDTEIEGKKKEITDVTDKITTIGLTGTKHKEEVDQLKGQQKTFKKKREEHQDLAMQRIASSPLALLPDFSDNLTSLFDCLDKNKLPEAAGKEWFLELAESNECVCDNKMTALMSENIRKKSNEFLSGNHQAVLNAIKGNYRQVVSPLITSETTESYFTDLKSDLDEAGVMNAKAMSKHNEIEMIAAKAATEQGVTEKISKLTLKRKKHEDELKFLEEEKLDLSGSQTNEKSLRWAENDMDAKQDELKKFTDAYLLTQREKILEEIVEDVRDAVTQQVCEDITNSTNKRTREILKTDDMELEKIEKSLILKGGKGSGSMGQTLVLAYSFLQSLHAKNNFKMPLIIDSPVGNLDNQNRRDVADLLWEMERKMIIFIINSEKPSFMTRLVKHAKNAKRFNELCFITNISRDGKTADFYDKLVNSKDADKDGSGGISYEYKFFDGFDVEDEEEEE